MSEEKCFEECKKSVDFDFYDEMENIIYNNYNRIDENGKPLLPFRYKYATIAELLDFDEEDIQSSVCNFSEERRRQAESERNRKKYLKRKEKQGETEAARRKREQKDYIAAHIDEPVEKIMKI